jgi:regulator of sigma E protease
MTWLVAILGLGLLMIVHEAGHFFAARSFGLRVLKFSIGFGPTFFKVEPDEGHYWLNTVGGRIKIKLWKHDPEKHGPTVFQVAMIPFLAYVQIDGMNPFEEIDPDDKGSYANASLLARVTTIVAGPLANYVSASVFFFITAYFAGLPTGPDERFISPMPDRPAIAAGFQEGDEVVAVNGTRVHTWTEMSKAISSANDEIPIVVRRGEQELTLRVKPQLSEDGRPIIGVKPMVRKADFGAAAKHAVVHPTEWVRQQLSSIRDLFTASEEVRLGGREARLGRLRQPARCTQHDPRRLQPLPGARARRGEAPLPRVRSDDPKARKPNGRDADPRLRFRRAARSHDLRDARERLQPRRRIEVVSWSRRPSSAPVRILGPTPRPRS